MAQYRIFISYKTGKQDGLSAQARMVRNALQDAYEVWMDIDFLVGSQEWNKELYERIPNADVLVLLLAGETLKSDWVRREVDVAKGAKVTVLPVIIRENFEIKEALEIFDLVNIQAVRFLEGNDDEIEGLVDTLLKIRAHTRLRQEAWFDAMLNQKQKRPVAIADKRIASYRLRDDSSPCRIHLAGGDITEMRGIDVIVNTENNYMQMARIFESSSLSSKLRWGGSRLNAGGHLLEDTLQQELYLKITTQPEYTLPIRVGYVVPTSAGHAQSRLVERNRARYVLHVATVTVHPNQKVQLQPGGDEDIDDAVENCLDQVLRINRDGGIIAPDNSPQQELERAKRDAGEYLPITSIIFPMLTTGRGGRETEVREVAGIMAQAIVKFLKQNADDPHMSLEHIHICGYAESDVHEIRAALDDNKLLAPA